MIIENEFTVGADIDTVWRELLDMEGVASCLPGATITSTDQDNVYDGSMRLKIGPMRVEYRGRATLSEVDEANHTAVISLSAREAKGQGSAMATIRNRLSSVDGGTKVSAETDLQITGPQAQFGRGVIEDVGKRVLGEFSQRLEERIAGSGSGSGASGPSEATGTGEAAPGSGSQAPAELDVGSLVTSSPVVRKAGAGALALALVAALVLIVLRRRR
ncbi:MAG TPA: SRPBCC family protein [Solirubrobacteraceae bacterium]|nr:SRPBCC family protein [Solirubrobacteraceae bacterium]